MARFQDGTISLILNGIRTPVNATDAANKSYVDGVRDVLVDSDIDTASITVNDTEATLTITRNDSSEIIVPFSIRDTNNVFAVSREGNVPGPSANDRQSQFFLRADGTWAAAAGPTGASITSARYDTDSDWFVFGLSNNTEINTNELSITGPAGAPGAPGAPGTPGVDGLPGAVQLRWYRYDGTMPTLPSAPAGNVPLDTDLAGFTQEAPFPGDTDSDVWYVDGTYTYSSATTGRITGLRGPLQGTSSATGLPGPAGISPTITFGDITLVSPDTDSRFVQTGTNTNIMIAADIALPSGYDYDTDLSSNATVVPAYGLPAGADPAVFVNGVFQEESYTLSDTEITFAQTLYAGDRVTVRSGTQAGRNGTDGEAFTTLAVGTTTTGNAGTNASVANSGTDTEAVFDFTIPRGADGRNITTMELFQRTNTAPTTPADSTYTIATDTFTIPTGWSRTIGSGDSDVYYTSARVNVNTATATLDWTTPVRIAHLPADGTNGTNGANGYSNGVVRIYQRAHAAPSAPADSTYTITNNTFTAPTGWSVSPPAPVGDSEVYVSSASYNTNSSTTATLDWGTPVAFTQRGATGEVAASNIKIEAATNGTPSASDFTSGVLFIVQY